jgi:hypothetical protein
MAGLNQIIRSYEPGTGLPAGEPYDPAAHPYPKHVYPNGPKMPYVQVASAEEEAEVMGTAKTVEPETEMARLTALADKHGLTLDGRWKIERIRLALTSAGYDPDEK